MSTKSSQLAFQGFEGFDIPNGTYTPDIFFDELAPMLGEAELRVLLYIFRRTFGFKKRSDSISLSQMEKGITKKNGARLDYGTGMSRKGVMKGCVGLLEKGIITVEKKLSRDGDNETNIYKLRFKSGEEVGNVVPYRREPSTLGVGNQVHPQDTVIQEADLQHSNSKINISGLKSNEQMRTPPAKPWDIVKDRMKESTSEKGSVPLPMQIPLERVVGHREQETEGKSDRSSRSHSFSSPSPYSPSIPTPVLDDADQQRICALIAELSTEFSDAAHLRSNKTRMLNIVAERRGIQVGAVLDSIYYAKGLTKEQGNAGAIHGSKMAYFFSVLKDKLNLPRAS